MQSVYNRWMSRRYGGKKYTIKKNDCRPNKNDHVFLSSWSFRTHVHRWIVIFRNGLLTRTTLVIQNAALLPNRNIAETFYCNTIFWICVTDLFTTSRLSDDVNSAAHVKLLHRRDPPSDHSTTARASIRRIGLEFFLIECRMRCRRFFHRANVGRPPA